MLTNEKKAAKRLAQQTVRSLAAQCPRFNGCKCHRSGLNHHVLFCPICACFNPVVVVSWHDPIARAEVWRGVIEAILSGRTAQLAMMLKVWQITADDATNYAEHLGLQFDDEDVHDDGVTYCCVDLPIKSDDGKWLSITGTGRSAHECFADLGKRLGWKKGQSFHAVVQEARSRRLIQIAGVP